MKYEYSSKTTTVDNCINENSMSTEWATMAVEHKPMHKKRKRSTKHVIEQRISKPVQARQYQFVKTRLSKYYNR